MTTKTIDSPARIAVATCEVHIAATPAEVYDLFLNRPDAWFYENEQSRASTPTRCQNEIGGKFYIELPDNGFNTIGEITMLKPGKKIRMRGDCTLPQAVLMNMTIAFDETESGTRVSIDHRMFGEFDDTTPAEFEAGWQDGLDKLKQLAESNP